MEMMIGVVESRDDPLKLGRCKVRVVGLHTHDKTMLPTEDLPWALSMQPISSAAISGIGFSPTGLVEGSSVIVVFSDEDQQQPIILGSFGGIPQNSDNGSVDNETLNIVDDDGLLETTTTTTTTTTIPAANMNMPSYYKLSQIGINNIKQFETKKLVSYKDTDGKYAIGYGLKTLNGAPIAPGQTITDAIADSSFYDWVSSVAEPDVVKRVKIPITQSMFDSLVSLAYNMGGPVFGRTTIVSTLNQGKYLEAAAQIETYTQAKVDGVSKQLATLVRRRKIEKDRFLSDGIDESKQITTETVSSSRDDVNRIDDIGFKDPKGKYPIYLNEPDTNRLARGERIETTIVRTKELTREKNVNTCGTVWSQSPVPYNTTYPFNYVYQSESGHVMEFDDTKGSERVHLYHKSGTFFEVDANGTEVKKIVGDGYEILERDGYLYIKGDRNVTIDGSSAVQVNNALTLDILGATNITIHNNCNINISGDCNTAVLGNYKLKAASITLEAENFNINSGKYSLETSDLNIKTETKTETISDDCNIRYDGDLHTHIGADTYNRHDSGKDYSCPSDPSRISDVDCSSVDNASGTDKTGLANPSGIAETINPDKGDLTVVTRGSELLSHYETIDEGTPAEIKTFDAKLEKKGIIDPTDTDNTTEKEAATPVKTNKVALPHSCDLINAAKDFPQNFQLSKHFTVASLTLNGKHKLKSQQGLSINEIVCNLKGLSENCLDIIKEEYPNMIFTSGFRPFGVPKESSKTSQHYLGQAADIKLNGFTKKQHYDAIQKIQQLIPYDQLIMEYAGANSFWIHISFKYEGNRKMHFTMKDHHKYGDIGKFYLIS